MIRTRADRQTLWDGVCSRAPLLPGTYGYDSEAGFQNQCSFLRKLEVAVSDTTHPQHAEALDMRDLWLDGIVGSAQFIELDRKIKFEHWRNLCADIQVSNMSANEFRAKVRFSTHLYRPDARTRKSYLDEQKVEPKAVDYKQRFREAEVRIKGLEAENTNLRAALNQIRELAGWVRDLTGSSSDD